ncbi:MAG: FAD-dependent oxidoreductase [Pseudomonadota bacterium]|nr:FAD-dependent oxidoreductase [Pseudomonadota bacterium]QKK05602.1 MAG: FAD-dependent oxidoreductase [Pseudomonadota bacterium]
MHIVIVGAGIVGTMTAYYLVQKGVQVTMIDRHEKAGTAASRANASLLCYGQKSPLGTPDIWGKIPKILLGRDPRIKIHKYFSPTLYFWLAGLLKNSSSDRYRLNYLYLSELVEASRELLEEIIEKHNPSFDHRRNGRLNLYPDAAALEKGKFHNSLFAERFDIDFSILSAEQCIEKIPSMKDRKAPLAGGIFTPLDASGNCEKFIDDIIEKYLIPSGLFHFMPETNAQRIVAKNGAIEGLITDKDVIVADHYVLCNGAWAPEFLKPYQIYLPIYPVKGYHIQCDMPDGLSIGPNIMDTYSNLVAMQLGDRLKLSTGFIFNGFNDDVPKKYLINLKAAAQEIFPGLSLKNIVVNKGFRPYTPDSLPIVKPSQKIRNLSYNLGHSMLGWTLAPATGKQCAEQIAHFYGLKQ